MVWASQVMRAERIQGAEGDLLLVVAAGDDAPTLTGPGILAFSIDQAVGTLTPLPASPFPAFRDPFDLVIVRVP
jgi:hypothetical protein